MSFGASQLRSEFSHSSLYKYTMCFNEDKFLSLARCWFLDLFYFSVCKILFKSNFCCISSPCEPWKAWARKDALNQLKILMNKKVIFFFINMNKKVMFLGLYPLIITPLPKHSNRTPYFILVLHKFVMQFLHIQQEWTCHKKYAQLRSLYVTKREMIPANTKNM